MLAEKFKSIVKSAVEGYTDPWIDRHIEKLPAEIVTRHRYIPSTKTWITDTSLIKMESKSFDKGAQRQIYRLKKISQAPTVNWRKLDWAHAPNYVAKCYITKDESIGTEDKIRCFNDVRLQYEAAHWANLFNKAGPPKPIHVIQCYVLELSSRPGSPVVGCERFVDGHDKYGAGFVKHNSNSGYVDAEEHRATPQAFSAHSFYASAGQLMVVDVQGVGDLYTDPQIHSQDDRFGDSDLGIRGMALFFVSFRRNPVCDYLKLPRFPLSYKERNRMLNSQPKQVKHLNNGIDSATGIRKDFQLHRSESMDHKYIGKANDTVSRAEALEYEKKLKSIVSFSTLSPTEQRSQLPIVLPAKDLEEIEQALSNAVSYALRVIRTVRKKDSNLENENNNIEEIKNNPIKLLELYDFTNGIEITEEIIFTTMDPNMIHTHVFKENDDEEQEILKQLKKNRTQSDDIVVSSSPLPQSTINQLDSNNNNNNNINCDKTIEELNKIQNEKLLFLQKNTAEVHLELSLLEAAGRFSFDQNNSNPKTQSNDNVINSSMMSLIKDLIPDISSCIFHLAEAVVLGSCAASLALGRLKYDLTTDILMTLIDYVSKDIQGALVLLMLAGFRGSANGACLAAQICENGGDIERSISLYQLTLYHLRNTNSSIENQTINEESNEEVIEKKEEITKFSSSNSIKSISYSNGEDIEVNYLGWGSWYPAKYVESIDSNNSKIRYVDGNQEEVVENNWIRKIQVEGQEINTQQESGEEVSVNDIKLNSLDINIEDTETNNIQNHQQQQQHLPNLESNQLNDLLYHQNDQSSLPSTVTSIGVINYSNSDIEYKHKIGIESDNVLFLTEFEILHALGRLHGLLTKKYVTQKQSQNLQQNNNNLENDEIYNQLCEITRNYYTEASNNAFEKGKVAFAMKCIEDAREYE